MEKEEEQDPAKEKDEEQKSPETAEQAMEEMHGELLNDFSKTIKGRKLDMDADKEAKDDENDFERDEDQSEL